MILICGVIMLIGFVGIYTKQQNKYVNKIPVYQLSADLKGEDTIELEVDDTVNTKYYDKDGKEVDASTVTDKNKKNYTEKKEAVNAEENLTEENYKKCVDIFDKRLKFIKADEYRLDLDKKTGKVVLTFSDDYAEDIENILPMEGKLELVDTKTEDVILDYTGIKSVLPSYAADEDGKDEVYLDFVLNKEGMDKINSLDAYKKSTDDKGEETTNQFTVQFDGETIGEVSYDDTVVNGKHFRVTLAKEITSTTTLNTQMNTATVVAKLANIGKMPVVYTVAAEEYVKATNASDHFYMMLAVVAAIAVLIALYVIVKYRVDGLLGVIGMATNIALIMIITRTTNITLSYNSLAAMVGLLMMNTYLVTQLLSNIKKNKEKSVWENVKLAYLKSIDVAFVTVLLFTVFAFGGSTVIGTMGLFFFWGWTIVMLGNLLFTSTLLAIRNGK